jgi:hypothetical protein
MRVMSTTRRLIRIMIIVSIMLSTPMCVETFYFYLFKTNFVFEKAGGNSTSSSLSVNLSLTKAYSVVARFDDFADGIFWFCEREAGKEPRRPLCFRSFMPR